jgi:hypothetical protein
MGRHATKPVQILQDVELVVELLGPWQGSESSVASTAVFSISMHQRHLNRGGVPDMGIPKSSLSHQGFQYKKQQIYIYTKKV